MRRIITIAALSTTVLGSGAAMAADRDHDGDRARIEHREQRKDERRDERIEHRERERRERERERREWHREGRGWTFRPGERGRDRR